MVINPADPRPPSQQVADDIREQIERGDIAPGASLPVTRLLREQYGVSGETIRQAVARLKAAGVVTARQGSGVYARPRPPMRRLGADRYSRSKRAAGKPAFIADRETTGRGYARDDQTQTVREVPASTDAAQALDVDEGAPLVERARVVRYEGEPTQALTSWYRRDDVAGTRIADPTPGPAGSGGGFSVLDELGIGPAEIDETFHARMPTSEETQLLHLPPGEPVMELRRVAYTADGRPVEYARGIYRASHFAWNYRFPIPD